MTTTAKDLIGRAFATRTANDVGRLATPRELIPVLSDFIRSVYTTVAANPETREFFGAQEDVNGAAGVWARPDAAIAVFLIEDSGGEEVSVVPIRDRFVEEPPRVYELGRSFYTVGETDDPEASDVLTIFYAKDHPELDPTAAADATENTLDASWPERHNSLLVDELARYMAFKASRTQEAKEWEAARDRKLALLLAEAKATTESAMRQRWG